MTDTSRDQQGTRTTAQQGAPAQQAVPTPRAPMTQAAPPARSAWTGWVVFGGVMLMLVGTFQAVMGFVALLDDGFYAVRPSGLVVDVSYNTWGWAHLGIGILAVLVGIGLMVGNPVARVVGVLLAGLSALANIAFLSAYPVWSTIVIAIDVVVIYAIVVHGDELRTS